MNQMILIPVPLDEFMNQMEKLVDEKIKQVALRPDEERLLSPADACKIFQPAISRVTLHTWAKEGRIPSHRIGGRVFYKLSEVVAAAKQYKPFKKE